MLEMPDGSGLLLGCGDGTLALVEDRSSYEDDRKAELEAIKARKMRTKLPQPPARLDGLVLKVVSLMGNNHDEEQSIMSDNQSL
jgi:hypothetical protein